MLPFEMKRRDANFTAIRRRTEEKFLKRLNKPPDERLDVR